MRFYELIDLVFKYALFGGGALVGCYSCVFYFTYLKSKQENRKVRDEFFGILISALKKGSVSSLDDIYIFYKGTYKLELDNSVYMNKVNSLLNEFLVYIHIPHLKNFQNVSEEEVKKLERPYSWINSTERRTSSIL